MNKGIVVGIVVLVLIVGGFFMFYNNSESQLIDSSTFNEADKLFVEYFNCLSEKSEVSCPEDNSDRYTGNCINIDSCSDPLSKKRIALEGEGSSAALTNPELNVIWYHCYFKGVNSPFEGNEGPSYSKSEESWFVKSEVTACWEGKI